LTEIPIGIAQGLELGKSIFDQLQYPLPRVMAAKFKCHRSELEEKSRERARGREKYRQLLVVIGSVLGGSDGINKSLKSSNGSDDLENAGRHGLRCAL
jgi:hypothetical protein